MIYIIKLITNFVIYYIFIQYFNLKYKLRVKRKYIFLLLISFVMIFSLINLVNIPVYNLLSSFLFFNLLSYILFESHSKNEYFKDSIFYILLVLVDSVCYFLIGLIYNGFAIDMVVYQSLASSILLFFIGFLASKIILRTEKMDIPYTEIFIFLIITLFSLLLILFFSAKYNYLIEFTNEQTILFFVIGIAVNDLIIIHYLEYINKNYEMKEQLIAEQKHIDLINQHYEDIKKSYEDTRKLVHDFNNHFQVICAAYESGNKELAEETISQYNIVYNNIKMQYITGSDILDIIVNEKSRRAKDLNIIFKFRQQQVDFSFIENFDLITIFGNLLDNAIEANEFQYKDIEKFIDVKIYKVNSMLVIKVDNSCKGQVVLKNSKLISTKSKNRGLGISNIIKSVKKYNGDLSTKLDQNIFYVVISIPCPV